MLSVEDRRQWDVLVAGRTTSCGYNNNNNNNNNNKTAIYKAQ